MSSSTLSQALPAGNSLRQDAHLIGLVGLAHLVSHFSQLLLPPLFPWLKDALNASYTQLGALMTIFFVVSCIVQTLSGFWVDKYGPRPILFAGLALLGVAAFGFSASSSYWMVAAFTVVAGIGNGVFHPVDYTLLNRKVSAKRLGHAYSTHGLTGSLGWALAPALLVPIALARGWQMAMMVAGVVIFSVWVALFLQRDKLVLETVPTNDKPGAPVENSLAFLKIPAVWGCFGFFFLYAIVISVIQAFAPEAARKLHDVPIALAAACLTIYMVCNAGGMIAGGFMAANPERAERVVGMAFSVAAVIALTLGLADLPSAAVPVLFGLMGFASGTASPSRDMLVKKSTPANSTGRVYGVVYSGLDIGQALAPLFFGMLMDRQLFSSVFIGLAAVQLTLIAGALNIRKARRV